MRRSSRLDALTGLRFIAAAHVLLFHYVRHSFETWPVAAHIVGSGYAAVGLFYVLSGFILVVVYGDRDLDRSARRRFWLARFAKVYPAYLLATVLWLPLALSAGFDNRVQWAGLASLFAMQAWFPALVTAWNTPAWSVSVEAFFYALFPLAVIPIRRMGRRQVWAFLTVVWGLSLLAPLMYQVLSHNPVDADTESISVEIIKFNPMVRLPEFLFGMGLGRLYRLGWSPARRPIIHLSAAIGALAILTVSDRVPFLLLHNGLLAPCFGALIIGLACSRSPLQSFLASRPMVVLGEASYSLYILQAVLPGIAPGVMIRLGVTSPWLNFTAPWSAVALVVGASLVVSRYYEAPVRQWIRNWQRFAPFAPTPTPAPMDIAG